MRACDQPIVLLREDVMFAWAHLLFLDEGMSDTLSTALIPVSLVLMIWYIRLNRVCGCV